MLRERESRRFRTPRARRDGCARARGGRSWHRTARWVGAQNPQNQRHGRQSADRTAMARNWLAKTRMRMPIGAARRLVPTVALLASCCSSHALDAVAEDGADRGTTEQPAAACPPPRVFCAAAAPQCPTGTYPEAEPCPGGSCTGRCWTGLCAPCGSECETDADCALVGRHGCCGPAGDCNLGCFWAAPASVLASDPCAFPASCPVPEPPTGCPTSCTEDPRCLACPHCAPQAARCEGGLCESAWPACEPGCGCD